MISKGLKKLTNKVGQIVQSVSSELYYYDGELELYLSGIEIKFADGISFMFGCSGDGSIFVSKGEAEIYKLSTESLKGGIVKLGNLELGILNEVTPEEEKLILKIGDSVLELENYGDDLIVFIDGEKQEFTVEMSDFLEPL